MDDEALEKVFRRVREQIRSPAPSGELIVLEGKEPRHGDVSRFSISLFMHGHSRQKKPRHKTTTDFFSTMNAEHHRYAIRGLHARHSSFHIRS